MCSIIKPYDNKGISQSYVVFFHCTKTVPTLEMEVALF